MHAEALRIDLRLLFEKSQPATAAKREEIPVVVLRMLAVFKDMLRTWQHRRVTRHIELRGIDRAPIGVRIAKLGLLAGVEGSFPIAAAAPVHRERRVTSRHEQLHLAHRASLAATMNVHHRRQFFLRAFRKAIHRRHACRLAFEAADEIAHMPQNHAVFLPLANDLRLNGIALRIKIRPKLLHRLRDAFSGKKRRQIKE